MPGVDQLAGRAHLGQHLGQELLAAEAGLDGHDEQGVEVGQDVEIALQRRARLEGEPGQGARGTEVAGDGARVGAGLGVHGDVARAGLGVAGRPALRVLDHQVAVERYGADRLHRLHHRQAEGQVRHEVRVHDVEVQPVGIGDALDLVGEAGEVRRQQARRDHRFPGHGYRV